MHVVSDDLQVPDQQVAQRYSDTVFDGVVIHSFLPNPIGSDAHEWIRLQNTVHTPISLDGCILDDIADGGSR